MTFIFNSSILYPNSSNTFLESEEKCVIKDYTLMIQSFHHLYLPHMA